MPHDIHEPDIFFLKTQEELEKIVEETSREIASALANLEEAKRVTWKDLMYEFDV